MSRVCHFYVIVMAHSADRQVTAVTYLFKAFEIRGNCWRSVWVDGCVFFFYSKSTYCVSSHLFRTLPHTHSICGGSLILDLGGACLHRRLPANGRVLGPSQQHILEVFRIPAWIRFLRRRAGRQREETLDGTSQIRLFRWVRGVALAILGNTTIGTVAVVCCHC